MAWKFQVSIVEERTVGKEDGCQEWVSFPGVLVSWKIDELKVSEKQEG